MALKTTELPDDNSFRIAPNIPKRTLTLFSIVHSVNKRLENEEDTVYNGEGCSSGFFRWRVRSVLTCHPVEVPASAGCLQPFCIDSIKKHIFCLCNMFFKFLVSF